MTQVESYANALKKEGFSDEEIQGYVRDQARTLREKLKQAGASEEQIQRGLASKGFDEIAISGSASSSNSRWNQILKETGSKEAAFKHLEDKYGWVLASKGGDEEFKTYAKQFEMPDADRDEFLKNAKPSILDKVVGFSDYGRAGVEGLGEVRAGLEQTAYDIGGLLPEAIKPQFVKDFVAGREKKLADAREYYDQVETYSENKHDKDWTDPSYYYSPEALRNVLWLVGNTIVPGSLGAKGTKAVAVLGKLAEAPGNLIKKAPIPGSGVVGSLANVPGAIVSSKVGSNAISLASAGALGGYVAERGQNNVDESLMGAFVGSVANPVIGGGIATGKAIKNLWTSRNDVNKYLKGLNLDTDPESLRRALAQMQLAADKGISLSFNAFKDNSVKAHAMNSSLKNDGFRKTFVDLAEDNSQKIINSFDQVLDDIASSGSEADVRFELSQALKDSQKALSQGFEDVYDVYGSSRLSYKNLDQALADAEFDETYIPSLKKAALEKKVQTFKEGRDFAKLLKKDSTGDKLLDSIPVQHRGAFANIFEESVNMKSLPADVEPYFKELKQAWRAEGLFHESVPFKKLQQYLTDSKDGIRGLVPRSTEDRFYNTKLAAIDDLVALANKTGKPELKEKVAIEYINDILNRKKSANFGDTLSGYTSKLGDLKSYAKAMESLNSEVLKKLLPKEKYQFLEVHSDLIKTLDKMTKGIDAKGQQIGASFNALSWVASQISVYLPDKLLQKAFQRDLVPDMQKALAQIKAKNFNGAADTLATAFPDIASSYAEQNSIKSKRNIDQITVYPRSKFDLENAKLKNNKVYTTTPRQGEKPLVINGDKVADINNIKELNPNITSVKALMNNPIMLRRLKNLGYEAFVTGEHKGFPNKIVMLGSRDKPRNITRAFDEAFETELNKVDKVPDTLGQAVDDAGERVYPTEPTVQLNEEQRKALKAHQRRMTQLHKKLDAVYTEPDPKKLTADYKKNFWNDFNEQVAKIKKEKEVARALGETQAYQNLVVKMEEVRSKAAEAFRTAKGDASKRQTRDQINANARQKTTYKNQLKAIQEDDTNLSKESQARKAYSVSHGNKYKNIEDFEAGFQEYYKGLNKKDEPFTPTEKTKENLKERKEAKAAAEEVQKAAEANKKTKTDKGKKNSKKFTEENAKKAVKQINELAKTDVEEAAKLAGEVEQAVSDIDSSVTLGWSKEVTDAKSQQAAIDELRQKVDDEAAAQKFFEEQREKLGLSVDDLTDQKKMKEVLKSQDVHPDAELAKLKAVDFDEKNNHYRYLRGSTEEHGGAHRIWKVLVENNPNSATSELKQELARVTGQDKFKAGLSGNKKLDPTSDSATIKDQVKSFLDSNNESHAQFIDYMYSQPNISLAKIADDFDALAKEEGVDFRTPKEVRDFIDGAKQKQAEAPKTSSTSSLAEDEYHQSFKDQFGGDVLTDDDALEKLLNTSFGKKDAPTKIEYKFLKSKPTVEEQEAIQNYYARMRGRNKDGILPAKVKLVEYVANTDPKVAEFGKDYLKQTVDDRIKRMELRKNPLPETFNVGSYRTSLEKRYDGNFFTEEKAYNNLLLEEPKAKTLDYKFNQNSLPSVQERQAIQKYYNNLVNLKDPRAVLVDILCNTDPQVAVGGLKYIQKRLNTLHHELARPAFVSKSDDNLSDWMYRGESGSNYRGD